MRFACSLSRSDGVGRGLNGTSRMYSTPSMTSTGAWLSRPMVTGYDGRVIAAV